MYIFCQTYRHPLEYIFLGREYTDHNVADHDTVVKQIIRGLRAKTISTCATAVYIK